MARSTRVDGPPQPWRYTLLRDQLDIYREHGAGWSQWTYKDIGLQGLVYARQDSPYLTRIADVLAAKRRLGVDSWVGPTRVSEAEALAASFRFDNCVERTELSDLLRGRSTAATHPGDG